MTKNGATENKYSWTKKCTTIINIETKWTLMVECHLKMYCMYIWSINRGWEEKVEKEKEEIKNQDVGVQNEWGMRKKVLIERN